MPASSYRVHAQRLDGETYVATTVHAVLLFAALACAVESHVEILGAQGTLTRRFRPARRCVRVEALDTRSCLVLNTITLWAQDALHNHYEPAQSMIVRVKDALTKVETSSDGYRLNGIIGPAKLLRSHP